MWPEDMDGTLQAQLFFDEIVFGSSFYEETEDGYERIDPTEAVVIYE